MFSQDREDRSRIVWPGLRNFLRQDYCDWTQQQRKGLRDQDRRGDLAQSDPKILKRSIGEPKR